MAAPRKMTLAEIIKADEAMKSPRAKAKPRETDEEIIRRNLHATPDAARFDDDAVLSRRRAYLERADGRTGVPGAPYTGATPMTPTHDFDPNTGRWSRALPPSAPLTTAEQDTLDVFNDHNWEVMGMLNKPRSADPPSALRAARDAADHDRRASEDALEARVRARMTPEERRAYEAERDRALLREAWDKIDADAARRRGVMI